MNWKVVGATARRQERSKIAWGVPMKKFVVDQYGFFGHATVLKKQPTVLERKWAPGSCNDISEKD